MKTISTFLFGFLFLFSTSFAANGNPPPINARVPDVKHVVPANAPAQVDSMTFVAILSGDILIQMVSNINKEKGPYVFLIDSPVGSQALVDLEDILYCLQKINPFATGSNQGVYLKNRLGQWNYVGLHIDDPRLANTSTLEHRCD
ncbi:MAG: hypothetical protein UW75_C0021G0003 [Parcubacteria group bacterium GW2011_GWF2_44_8]|nr:MAG: hypothetical protein UW75_C0021G0003 [Parcubacteria group bacterium GW2011_GWF2_44_8]